MKILNFKKSIQLLAFFASCFLISSCSDEKGTPDFKGYPDDIGKLVFSKCATSGCHTDASKEAAGGFSMQSWDALFQGGHNGAAVIPYRSDYSPMFFFCNTFSDLGTTLGPTMPYNKDHLDRETVVMLKNWIDAGAPSRDGSIKFSDDPNRKKYYVTNQGCDVVTVFDEATNLPIRYINVGQQLGTEAPHMIHVSPDKKYWYVLSLAGYSLEKYRTSDDSFVARANIGSGYWNAFTISNNSQTAFCTDMSPLNGDVAVIDLNTMTVIHNRPFNYPHGIALNNANDTLYITQQVGSSKIYKVPVVDFSGLTEINLFTGPTPSVTLDPHEVAFAPDGSKYFVTCQGTGQVRVFQTGTDQLIATIPVGASPSEMSFSKNTNYLFISCTEDTLNFPGKRGSVAVINYATNTFVKYIYTGHQPHGIIVDDSKKTVIVANRNAKSDGPAPHHASACGGRNGYVTYIDINTLNMVPSYSGNSNKSIEVSVDPYSVSIR